MPSPPRVGDRVRILPNHTCVVSNLFDRMYVVSDGKLVGALAGRGPRQVELRGTIMTKQHFGTSHVPLSPAVRAGDFVFVSGQVPVGKDGKIVEGGIGAQTTKVLENVSAALGLAGCTMSDIVKTTVWLKRAEDFPEFQRRLRAVLPEGPAGALDRRVAG